MDLKIDLTEATDKTYRPTLHDVHRVLDEEVVGENESRMSLFTLWLCSDQNVMMGGPRSSGKTFITDHVMSFVGDIEESEKGQGYVLTAGSDKSAYYQAEDINRSKYVVVLELNKLNDQMKEMLKDWGEGKASTYKSTQMIGGDRKVKKFKLERRPFVFCLADEDETKLDVQLASRLTLIRTDDSIQQNKAVMTHQAKMAMLPHNPLQVDKDTKSKLKEHIKTMPPLGKYLWKHPCSPLFVDSVPAFFTDCRRDFPKYLANVNGICRFHWKERLKTIVGNKEAYLLTPADMFYNHIIFGKTLISSALKCNNIEREVMRIVGCSEDSLKRADIQKELKKGGRTLSAQMVSKHLKNLTDIGYLEVGQSEKDKKTYEYKIGQMFNEFLFEIDWKKVVEQSEETVRKLYPDIADEYKKKFCDTPIVRHPLTNEEINLREIEVEKVKTSFGQMDLLKCDTPKTEPKKKTKDVGEMTDDESIKYFQALQEGREPEVIEEEFV